jgi:hypothetical protein
MLFGRPVDLASLHPKIRDVYADAFKQMDDMDKVRVVSLLSFLFSPPPDAG